MTLPTPRAAAALPLALLALLACRPSPPSASASTRAANAIPERQALPTGMRLDPAGASVDVGNLPLAIALAPDRRHAALLLSGWQQQGLQVVDRSSGRVTQTLLQPAAFLGLAFSPDGRSLYASGGNADVIYRYAWAGGRAALADSIVLGSDPATKGARYPAGLALSRDGRTLYVAENVVDSLAVIDVASRRVVQRLATGRYPYAIAVAADGAVYASAWGGTTVATFRAASGGALTDAGRIEVGRHPSALALSADGSRLFVASASTDRIAVVDTKARRVIATLADPPGDSAKARPGEGSTPDALALSADGARLYVAEADNNAVAVFELSAATSGVATACAETANACADRLAGRMPTGWYPSALALADDSLLVVDAKGRGTRPNPARGQSNSSDRDPTAYTLGAIHGTLTTLDARADSPELALLSERVRRADGWDRERTPPAYPPFEHVIYIVKENRTYDQLFADLSQGDGDASLLFFPRAVSPNHHALAERFGLFDRFFVNAEVSAQGHPWSMSAYVTDYTEKTVHSGYSGRRPDADEGDIDEPATGFLWNLAIAKGVTLRNYGEYAQPEPPAPGATPRYQASKPALRPYTHPEYPSFDMTIPDQRRADLWIAELGEFVRRGAMPRLEIVHLPRDHTSGARAGFPTPRAHMADNDLALGRMIEALSRTPFWKNTVVFVLEDDAQDGPDHVDSHRSVLMVISPYTRAGAVHRFVNTTDVLATIEEILGLGSLSQFDQFGRPLRDIFADAPDLAPYSALTPSVSLTEMNPDSGAATRQSSELDLDDVDAADDAAFNRVLWLAIKGDSVPYPGRRRMSALEAMRGR